MTCKNCLSYDVCKIVEAIGINSDAQYCKYFKDISDFVKVCRCKECIYNDDGYCRDWGQVNK